MTRAEEATFEKKAERHFNGQRPTPNGRSVLHWHRKAGRDESQAYRDNYDATFQPQTRIGRMLAEMDGEEANQ